MFHNSYQSGFLSILYSIGSRPLQIWDTQVTNGHVKRITDEDIQSSVLEIMGSNVSTCFITCPANPKQTLGIKLPFLVMIIKNMKKYFSFEVTILDDKNIRRRFRASNYQSTTKVKPFICTMPMRLDEGWNQIQFNLSDFTRRAYGTNYLETLRVQVHANCRIRRLYFSDRLYAEEELPPEFKLFLPISQQPQQQQMQQMQQQPSLDTQNSVSPQQAQDQNQMNASSSQQQQQQQQDEVALGRGGVGNEGKAEINVNSSVQATEATNANSSRVAADAANMNNNNNMGENATIQAAQ